MDEQEEFEFRARAEAEAAQAQHPKVDSPSLFEKGVAWVGRQLSRLPAAIRGAVQAYQNNDAYDAANMAWQGLKDPESVQTSPEMMARFGADTTKYPVTYPAQGTDNGAQRNAPIPALPAQSGISSHADAAGEAFDAVAPTGLEFLPAVMARGLGRLGRGVEEASTNAIQSSLKPSRQLRNIPVPYESANFLTERPGAPAGGLASAMGKRRTLENIEAFHDRLGAQQDALLQQIPQVDLMQSVAHAAHDIDQAIAQGGNQMLGLSARDADALRAEIDHWAQAAERVSPNGITNGPNARQFRGSLGHEARYNGSETTNARRVVAATIRERLNDQLDQLSPEFRQLDQQFAETIPLRNAVADALGREGNKYPIGLRTSMILATHGASIPAEIAKMAMIEGTSRFAPQVAMAKLGRLVAGGAEAAQPWETLPIPAIQAARLLSMPENAIPFRLRNVAGDQEDAPALPILQASASMRGTR